MLYNILMRSVASYRRDFRIINCSRNVKVFLFDNPYHLAMSFLRPQEFQESPKFCGEGFDLEDFMEWYSLNQSSYHHCFTYPHDWRGFNISGVTLLTWYNCTNYPLTNRERAIFFKELQSPYIQEKYFIGILDSKKELGTLRHELTHAVWGTCTEYRNGCIDIISKMHPRNVNSIYKYLMDKGYVSKDHLLMDELNAYMMTGGIPGFRVSEMQGYRSLRKLWKTHVEPLISKVDLK